MFDSTASKLLRALDGFQFTRDAWPDQRDTEGEKEPGEVARETREKCNRLWRERGPEAWPILEQYADSLTRQIEQAEQELAQLTGGGGNDDHRRRVRLAQLVADGKRRAVRRFLRSHDPLDVPEPAGDVANPDASSHAHNRTVSIGRALIQHRKQNDGALPDTDSDGRPFYGQKEQFKAWAGEVIGCGVSTAYNAMSEAGCYRPDRMDNKQTVEQVVSAVMDYARRHSDRLKNGVEKF